MKQLYKRLALKQPFSVILVLCFCVLCIYLITTILYKILCESNLNTYEITFLIGSTKDIFQILIFIIVGVITILSYLQARKTLFTPIKTEIFKFQIKAFEEILTFFQNKTETDFMFQFDFNFIVKANSRLMMADFITHFHEKEIKLNEENLEELHKEFGGAVATKTWAEKNFSSPDYFEKSEKPKADEITNPAIILDNWKKYEYGPINFSKKYYEEITSLKKLIVSPLIPNELKDKLQKFSDIIEKNLTVVGKVLNSIAQELPQSFPTAKSLKNFEPIGMWNRYNDEKEDVEQISMEILSYIRIYLKIESLVN